MALSLSSIRWIIEAPHIWPTNGLSARRRWGRSSVLLVVFQRCVDEAVVEIVPGGARYRLTLYGGQEHHGALDVGLFDERRGGVGGDVRGPRRRVDVRRQGWRSAAGGFAVPSPARRESSGSPWPSPARTALRDRGSHRATISRAQRHRRVSAEVLELAARHVEQQHSLVTQQADVRCRR